MSWLLDGMIKRIMRLIKMGFLLIFLQVKAQTRVECCSTIRAAHTCMAITIIHRPAKICCSGLEAVAQVCHTFIFLVSVRPKAGSSKAINSNGKCPQSTFPKQATCWSSLIDRKSSVLFFVFRWMKIEIIDPGGIANSSSTRFYSWPIDLLLEPS